MTTIVISSGHGKKIRGASGYIDEVDEARRVVDRVAEMVGSGIKTFHDDVSTTQDENLHRIVDYHNKAGAHDLDVSVHFNAYQTTSKPMGTECLYVTQEELSKKVAGAIAGAGKLINRGPKYRDGLYFLNKTKMPSILIEVAFVDSSEDAKLYNANFEAICKAIAETISGKAIGEQPGQPPGRPERPEPPEPIPPEPIPPDDEMPMIGIGDRGPAVARCQAILGLPDDGIFGSVTEGGVKGFQGAS